MAKIMTNFSLEEEELLRKFIFTNPHSDISFVYPQPLIAAEELSPLMSAYSRTHISMQDRVLQFLDKNKQEQTRSCLGFIPNLIEIFRNSDGTLKMTAKTAIFNRLWPLKHGHASIKEETALFGHCENISDVTGKKITGHPLNKPQVKSTRYLSFKKALDLSLEDTDILSLNNSETYLDHINNMNIKYLNFSDKLTDFVFNHKYTKDVSNFLKRPENIETEINKRILERIEVEEGFSPTPKDYEKEGYEVLKSLQDSSVKQEIGKFILDYSRVYLLAVTRTSIGFSIDARSLEEIITDMISSPRREDQAKGHELWNEAKKIAPVLLGENSHVKVNEWNLKNELELRSYIEEKFGNLQKIYTDAVTVLHPINIEMLTDKFNAALIIYNYTNAPLQEIIKTLSEKDVYDVLERAHRHRGNHDVIHPAISHGGLLIDMLMPYHAYRDIFRHRRGSRSMQLLDTRRGFEDVEIFKVFNLDKEYQEDMKKSSEIYESARKISPHIAEKLVPFGANCRALHSWHPNQVGYIGKLRSNIEKGNFTYVKITREMMQKVSQVIPATGKFFKFDTKEYPVELWKRGYDWWDKEGKYEYTNYKEDKFQ